MSKKYNNEFEHLYLLGSKLKIISFNVEALKHYESTINMVSKSQYERSKSIFEQVGFDSGDLKSICMIYASVYFDQYSCLYSPEYSKKYLEKHGPLDEKTLAKRDRNNLITFLQQKTESCRLHCTRKSRNILGSAAILKYYAKTKNSVKACKEEIRLNTKKLGYRELTQREYSECLLNSKKTKQLTDKDGFDIIVYKQLPDFHLYDYVSELEDTAVFNTYCGDPFTALSEMESEIEFDTKQMEFKEMSSVKKQSVLNKFINKNKDNKLMKRELGYARKLIKLFRKERRDG